MKDFYYILGTDENCTFDDIKGAYRKLSKKFHPDVNQNDKYFESRFREIQEAYEILSDPAKRSKYNDALKRSRSGSPNFSQHSSYRPTGTPNQKRSSPISKSKTRSVDILFTIILIFITAVFADYVIKSMSSSKAVKVESVPVVSVVSYASPKHHKKRHSLKFKAKSNLYKASSDNIRVSAAQPVPSASPRIIQPVQSTNTRIIQPIPDSNKALHNKAYLYAAYIRSNITGVTYMRRFDKFSSAVIKVIPDNSEVFVLQKGDAYYKVLFNSDIGYVPKWALQTK
jgi:hypothetical protein